jgi:hypothetical protein
MFFKAFPNFALAVMLSLVVPAIVRGLKPHVVASRGNVVAELEKRGLWSLVADQDHAERRPCDQCSSSQPFHGSKVLVTGLF